MEVVPTAHCWQIHHPAWVHQHHKKITPSWGPQTFHGQPGFSYLPRKGFFFVHKLQWPWSEWPLCRTCPLSPAAAFIGHGKSPKDMRNASLNRMRAQTRGNIKNTEKILILCLNISIWIDHGSVLAGTNLNYTLSWGKNTIHKYCVCVCGFFHFSYSLLRSN